MLMEELSDRMKAVYKVARERERQLPQNADRLNETLESVARRAPLYLRQPIPARPLRLLLRKVIRRFVVPFLMPQVEFNEAVRDTFLEMRRQLDDSRAARLALQEKIEDLELQVGLMTARIDSSPRPISSAVPDEPRLARVDEAETNPVARIAETLRLLPPVAADFAIRSVASGISATPPGLRRVAFLSPFPPVPSGVSDYSEEIVTPLLQHFDLDLYTADGSVPRISASFPVQGYTVLDRALREAKTKRPYDFLIYQIGNNSAFHADMYALLLRYAGIVVLHDYVITNLVMGVHYNRPDLGVWLPDEFAHHCGAARGEDLFARLERGDTNPDEIVRSGVHLTRRLFTRSLGVIVHNQWSYEMAIANHAADNPLITLIPPVMPPVPLDDTPDSIAGLRRKYGIPIEAFVIAPCGIVTKTKRPLEILDAFRALLADRPDAHLVFVGSVSNQDLPPGVDFTDELARRGLAEKVTISGYVDVPTFNEYLRLSDVCVTLRYPSQGETSGALLRMLVHGKASIVTAIGSFANFPDDTVHKLPIPEGMSRDAEVAMILDAFRLLATNEEYRLALGARGAAYIQREHSPERCANLYAEFGEAVLRHPATRAKLAGDYAARELVRHDLGQADLERAISAFSRAIADARALEPSPASVMEASPPPLATA